MKPESATKAEERATLAWRSMMRAAGTARRLLRREFGDLEISGPQFVVLRVLGEAGAAGVKLSEISQKLSVTSANMTGLIDRLEESGHVTRESDAEDRRVLLAKLTHKGRKFLEKLLPIHRAYVMQVMSSLSAEEQTRLTELLSRVAEQAAAIAEDEGDCDA
jgi:MarR family 2-MHQ and catechol resistance regulon transcriptional repressor